MPSRRVRTLEARIRELDATLLPAAVASPAAPPPPDRRQQDQIRAFVMLAHAELEHCIEDLALDAVSAIIANWKSDRVPRRVLQGLLAQADPKDLSDAWYTQPQDFRYENVAQKFARLVDKNMGIVPRNTLKLLISIGIPRAQIDDVWLTELKEFGNERGMIAHRGAISVATLPDAGRARARVNRILTGLRDMDAYVRRMRRRRAVQRTFLEFDEALMAKHEILRRSS